MRLKRVGPAFDRIYRKEQNENLDKIEQANSTLETKMDSLISGNIDDVALQADIEQKLNDLETQYAPKLTEVSTQLNHIAINPITFGAVGDGVANDTSVLTVLFSNPNYINFHLPEGYTFLVDPLTVTSKNNFKLYGKGVLKTNNILGLNVLTVIDSNDIEIEGINIEGSKLARKGIELKRCKRYKVKNIKVKDIGNDSFDNSATGVHIIDGSDGGEIDSIEITYVHATSNKAAAGISIEKGTDTGSVLPINTTIRNATIKDIAPIGDADGVKIISTDDIEANLLVENCYFYDCKKRGIKFQAKGCKSRNNYIEFVDVVGLSGIDFQRGKGQSLNDTIIWSPSVTSAPSTSLESAVSIAGEDILIDGLRFENKISSLTSAASNGVCGVRGTSLEGYTSDLKNIKIINSTIKGTHNLLKSSVNINGLTVLNCEYDTYRVASINLLNNSLTISDFFYRDNRESFGASSYSLVNVDNAVTGGSVELTNFPIAKHFISRSKTLKILKTHQTEYPSNFEQKMGYRRHFMSNIPSSYTGSTGNIFNACIVGDTCTNTNPTTLSDSTGNYIIKEWICVGVANGTNTRGVWSPVKQYM